MTVDKFSFNRVLKLSDYQRFKINKRKAWEIAMALKTLREWGATGKDSCILGVGAGLESTIFHLANSADAKKVIATDIYEKPGSWSGWHGKDVLENPSAYIPDYADPSRVEFKHADMCELPFNDNSFDGIFSSGSIEHVGIEGIADWDAIGKAAREIGRVLKPGGIASISTEWKLSGNGWGWSHVRLFDEETIYSKLIDKTGLDLVDEPDWTFEGSLADALTLKDIVQLGGLKPDQLEYVLKEHQYIYTSVHLALRKVTS